jgi:hypothetical protein
MNEIRLINGMMARHEYHKAVNKKSAPIILSLLIVLVVVDLKVRLHR